MLTMARRGRSVVSRPDTIGPGQRPIADGGLRTGVIRTVRAESALEKRLTTTLNSDRSRPVITVPRFGTQPVLRSSEGAVEYCGNGRDPVPHELTSRRGG
jgi:hypothetical protein